MPTKTNIVVCVALSSAASVVGLTTGKGCWITDGWSMWFGVEWNVFWWGEIGVKWGCFVTGKSQGGFRGVFEVQSGFVWVGI